MDKKKILVVDDEKDILLMLEKRLTAEEYSVITATNGTNALQLAKSKCPDLIILDVVMPSMGGGEVAEKLKEDIRTKAIPVIFLTALLSKTEDYKEDHIIAGNITLPKPIDTEELLDQIQRLLYNMMTPP
jgi:two-component system sensor histidine kinase/response regulator